MRIFIIEQEAAFSWCGFYSPEPDNVNLESSQNKTGRELLRFAAGFTNRLWL
jgi:hypothetical protein